LNAGATLIAYRPEIDGLRALAISTVVMFHAGSSLFPGGYVGVDIFFVISGYLITSIIAKEVSEGSFSFVNFYARRARRILPALFFVLVTTTAVAFALLLPSQLVEYGKVLIYTVLFGANFRLAAAADYFQPWSSDNPLLHMWSLAVEEQFYVLWPSLFLLLTSTCKPNHTKIAVVCLAALSLAVSEVLVHVWPQTAFFHLPARGWELLAGALLALKVLPSLKDQRAALWLSMLGLVLMIAPAILYSSDMPFPGLSALPPVLGCSLVIYAETDVRTRAGRWLSWPPIIFVGLISYSLYLWHWPCFAFLRAAMVRDLTSLEALACVALATVLAIISLRFVERPFRRLAPPAPGFLRIFIPSPRAYLASALAAGLIFSGSYFQKSAGAAWRVSGEAQAYLAQTPPDKDCIMQSRAAVKCKVGIAAADEPGAFVLWGDSHARRYLPALKQVYESGTVFLYPGCSPLLDTIWVDAFGRTILQNCTEENSRVALEIERLKPKVVIIASRWTLFEEPFGLEKSSRRFFVTSTSKDLTRENTHRIFEAQLEKTIRQFTRLGIQVVILGQVPEMRSSVTDCVVMSVQLGLEMKPCTTIRREEVEARQKFINETLNTIAAQNPNVTVFMPMHSLCDPEVCHAMRNGRLLYSDNHHINEAGARALQDDLMRTLAPLNTKPNSRSVEADPKVKMQ
jgi:peptidoglycan/LPS O-acetylase OafA/YrhL